MAFAFSIVQTWKNPILYFIVNLVAKTILKTTIVNMSLKPMYVCLTQINYNYTEAEYQQKWERPGNTHHEEFTFK